MNIGAEGKTWGFGILGTGMIAEFHQQAIQATPGAELRGIAHHNPERHEELSTKFGVPAASEAELLANPDIDVIIICTPSGQHAEQGIRAARAGKHVLVEKPMALSRATADELIRACDEAGVLLGVCLQRRTEPLFRRIREAVQAGDLGTITLASLILPYFRPDAYYAQADWRGSWEGDGGGVLMNQGIHLIDLLVWILGDPEVIQAQAATLRRNVEVEDTVAASISFPGGALATITGTTTAEPGFPHELRLHGDRGSIIVTGEDVTTWQLLDPSAAQVAPVVSQKSTDAGAAGDPRAIGFAGHARIIADFVAALNGGSELSIDGAEGRRSLSAVLGIYEAAGILQRSGADE